MGSFCGEIQTKGSGMMNERGKIEKCKQPIEKCFSLRRKEREVSRQAGTQDWGTGFGLGGEAKSYPRIVGTECLPILNLFLVRTLKTFPSHLISEKKISTLGS